MPLEATVSSFIGHNRSRISEELIRCWAVKHMDLVTPSDQLPRQKLNETRIAPQVLWGEMGRDHQESQSFHQNANTASGIDDRSLFPFPLLIRARISVYPLGFIPHLLAGGEKRLGIYS